MLSARLRRASVGKDSDMVGALAARLAERRRIVAHREFHAREHRLRPGYKVWGYQNIFAKGFLISQHGAAMVRDSWQTLRLGSWHAQIDPDLEHTTVSNNEVDVLLLGHAFDERGAAKRHLVAERILRAATRFSGDDDPLHAVDEYATWLSGRFAVVLRRGFRLHVWNDPLASKSVYFHEGHDGVALASHSALLADVAGGLASTRMRWVLSHPDYKSPAGKWLPGLITPHDEVGQLFANCRLTIEDGRVRHERFFPIADRVEVPPGEAAERFAEDLRQQVRNWTSVSPLTALTLTAGRDSRAILEAGLLDFQRVDALALSYHPFHAPNKSTLSDLTTGNRVAISAGLHHMPVNVASMSPRSLFAKLYNETFPTWHRYPALANALYLQAPAKASMIFGVGGAIITGMYKDTSAPAPIPEVLAAKYAQSKFAEDPELLDEMTRWIEFTGFSSESMRGYDFHDFFHWEHRMTKWGGAGYAEYDLATTPAPVLSSRRLLVAALSLPKPMRVDALVYRYISEGRTALN